MSKRAWAFAILIGTFALIGGQFRCSGGTGVVPVGAVTVNPSAPTIGIGATEAFKASVYNPLGTVGTVSWSIKEGAAGGSITQQGVYTAPTTPGSYTVVASFSSSPVEPGQATVNVVAPDEITVSVSPPSANLFAQNPNVNIYPGGSQLFTATVTGTPNTQVNWSIDQVPPNNPGLGWVTPGGLFTAGVYSGLYYVRATPVSDNFPNPGGYAVVNVTYPSRLNVTLAAAPNSAIVTTGGTQTFTATVNGTASTAVNWLVSEGDVGGIISAAGVYTAPATVGVYHVLAISQADPTQSSLATVNVIVPSVAQTNVYAAGYCFAPGTSGVEVPGYWLNGTWVGLTPLNSEYVNVTGTGPIGNQVNSLVVSGSDVYAAGDNFNNAGVDVPGYWLNGTWVGFTPIDPTQNSSIQSLVMSAAGNLYAAGYSTNSSGARVPGYWVSEGGISNWVNLSLELLYPTLSGGQANAISVVVNYSGGSDVYVAGTVTSDNPYVPLACYWLNDAITVLFQGGGNNPLQESGSSLFVSGSNLYTGGSSTNGYSVPMPGYWVNGGYPWVGLAVPTGLVQGSVTSIVGDGINIYAGGFCSSASVVFPGYWLNGVWVGLTPLDSSQSGGVNSLALSGSDVYAAGYYNNSSGVGVPGYWVNGTWVGLPPLLPSLPGQVNSINVVSATIAAPSNLTYSNNSPTYTMGTPIIANTPSSTGGPVTSYRVGPALPTGLNLDPITGVITGTPAAVSPMTSYIVIASNAGGIATDTLSITVNPAVIQPPMNLTYSSNPAVYTANVAIAPNNPTSSGGAVAGYGVTPSLPTGLILDPLTGIITGTPTVVTPQATYTVTASNGAGQTTCGLVITVPAPSTLVAELALPPFVHPNDTWMQASVLPAPGGLTYLWTLLPGTSSGTITSGQGTDVIAFSAGSSDGDFLVQANVQNGSGGNATVQRTVTVQNGTWLVEDGGPATARTGATATLLPSGRVLVAGGETNFYNALASAEIYDPATGFWFTTGAMGTAREHHTATLLADGTVLVAGGYDGAGNNLDSAEIFNPATGAWTPTSNNLTTARGYHTATLLPGGNVLVVGGQGQSGTLATGEIYSPGTGKWSLSNGQLNTARYSHTATLLSNNTVLVAGGTSGISLMSAEIYTPGNDSWAPTGSMAAARSNHTATLLYNNAVLAVGGYGSTGLSLASAEIYNYTNGTWSTTGSMSTARAYQTATLLTDGTVLAAGGLGSYLDLASAETYNYTNGTWSTTGSLNLARSSHIAALLNDGTVLVAGGAGLTSTSLASSEIYTPPPTSTWSVTAGRGSVRHLHTATLLPGGNVLVAGGEDDSGTALATAYIYNPATRVWSNTGTMNTARYSHTATLLGDGTVLVAGGLNQSRSSVGTGEIFDPSTGNWSLITSPMVTARHGHTSTLLGNGTVLLAGGDGSLGALESCEIYAATGQTWTATGSLNAARAYHTATLVGGQVLAAGGQGSINEALDSAEIFNGATWLTVGPMTTGRDFHTATLLADGVTVLLAGGNGSGASTVATAELYNSALKSFASTGSMQAARQYHTATLLPNGTVLVAGGYAYTGGLPVTLAGAEIYNPASGVMSWTATGPLGTARYSHTAILLNDGTVLVSFGEYGDVVSEIYLP